MPGDSGVLVVTRVRSTTTKCTRGRGCNGHPAFPTPFMGREINANLGRNVPRDREVVCGIRATSLRGAKRRSNPYFHCGKMDCFASLAMTVSTAPYPPAVVAREGGRSSIPETPMMEARSRGVLDTPLSRSMTGLCGAAPRAFAYDFDGMLRRGACHRAHSRDPLLPAITTDVPFPADLRVTAM
jgi:hypothetical protein